MITLKNSVIKSAKLVKDYQSIKTEIGGGMHPKAAALWDQLETLLVDSAAAAIPY